LLGHGAGRLSRKIRLLCTDVWPALYQMLALQTDNPVAIWGLPKERAIPRLPAETPAGQAIRHFHRAVLAYYPDESALDDAFAVIRHGLEFLYAAKAWWQERNDACLTA